MINELNELIRLIEEHFKNCIWNSRPPLKEIDFQLIILSQKIINLRNNLDKIKDVDLAISEIMTFLEGTFKIPLLIDSNWFNQNKVRRQLIIDVYNKLSNLRTF